MSSTRTNRSKCIRRIYDAFLLSTVQFKASDWNRAMGYTAAVGLIISGTGVIYPKNTYIRCNDPDINHTFQKDTISVTILLIVSLLVPWLIMLIFEYFNFRQGSISRPFYKGSKKAYSYLVSLFIGNLFAFFVVEMLKTTVSEPRPNFMSTCSPNLTSEHCQNQWVHVTYENCSNPMNLPHRKLVDTMKSFPSGHASISVFSAVFITMYVQERVKVPWSKLLATFMHLVCWVWTLLCCTSRVWDRKHHWWDVIFGGLLGAIAGYFTVRCMCKAFRDYSREISSDNKISKENGNGSLTDEKCYYSKPDAETKEACSHHTSTEPIVKKSYEE